MVRQPEIVVGGKADTGLAVNEALGRADRFDVSAGSSPVSLLKLLQGPGQS